MNNWKKRGWFKAAALVAASGVVALAAITPANAAPVDGTQAVDLTIHKYTQGAGTPGNTANDGSDLSGTVDDPATLGFAPLDGAEFTRYTIEWENSTAGSAFAPFSMTSNADQALMGEFITAVATSSPTLAQINATTWTDTAGAVGSAGDVFNFRANPTGVVAITGDTVAGYAAGEIAWTNVGQGLYYVVETLSPAGLAPVVPFLVTLPMTNPAGTGWNYDVHVYPKDADNTAQAKIALDEDVFSTDDQLNWEVSSEIPANPVNFEVEDRLPATLDYDTTGTVLVEIEDTSVVPATRTAVPAAHYTITGGTTGVNLKVAFDQTGSNAYLQSLAATDKLVITVPTEAVITAGVNYVGEITNTAVVTNNGVSATVTAKSTFGGIKITKKNNDPTPALLPNASFKVYASHAATFPGIGAAGTTDTGLTATTNASGVAIISGLRYSDLAAGGTAATPAHNYYWLVETAAPTGYQALVAPIGFEIDATTIGSATGTDAHLVLKDVINSVKVNPTNPGGSGGAGIQLPFTGGTGAVLFYMAGALLLGGVIFLVVRKTRKNENR